MGADDAREDGGLGHASALRGCVAGMAWRHDALAQAAGGAKAKARAGFVDEEERLLGRADARARPSPRRTRPAARPSPGAPPWTAQ